MEAVGLGRHGNGAHTQAHWRMAMPSMGWPHHVQPNATLQQWQHRQEMSGALIRPIVVVLTVKW